MRADDLDWQDVKRYDVDQPSPMETPNIDALAKRRLLFKNGYSPAPNCSPSRCAIMSRVNPRPEPKRPYSRRDGNLDTASLKSLRLTPVANSLVEAAFAWICVDC